MVRPRPLLAGILLCCLCVDVSSSRATANLIVNGGFETPVLTSGDAVTFATGQTVPLTGGAWTVLGDPGTSIYLLQTNYSEPFNNVTDFNAHTGLNSIDLSGPANVGPSAGVSQTVAVTPGQQYVLSFFVGRVTPNAGPGGVYPGPATVDVVIDGGPRQSFTNVGTTNGFINWRQFYLTFTATGPTATIAFLNGTPSGTNEAGLDDVSLIANSATGVGDTPPARVVYLWAPVPNPARGSTSVSYSLPEAGHVELAVYDVAGHRIQLLREGWEAAGMHGVTFQTRDLADHQLPSGVYFVSLGAEGHILSHKLVVVR